MKLKIRIPKSKLEAFQSFCKLSLNERNQIIDKINFISPESPMDIVDEIAKETALNQGQIREILDFLGHFYINYYAFHLTKEDFLENIISSSLKYYDMDLKIDENIKESLKKVLEMENSLGILSKLTALSRDNPHLFALSRIITDLRHIYYNNPSKPPEYAFVKHSMIIEYLDNDNILKDIVITMSYDDLLQLKEVVDRAIDKEQTIRNLSEKQGLKLLKEFEWVD